MRDIQFWQGGETLLHPITIALMLALAVAMLALPRRWALIPVCLTVCLIPMQQRVVIAGLDFDMGRIIILVGWARILGRNEFRRPRLTGLEIAFALWLFIGTLFYFLRDLALSSLIYRAGVVFDALGMFYLCRTLVHGHADVVRVFRILCWVGLLVSPLFLYEVSSGFNVFSILGGIDAASIVRDGRVRAQGAFAHPIMAGAFGATLFPLAIALWRAQPRHRLTAAAGLVASAVLTLTPASSGAFFALATSAVGWALWVVRDTLPLLRWATAGLLVLIHFVREKPVWHLIGRASELVGGTGWHRFAIIDAFIANWREWILFGTGSTKHWGWGLQDITNQFVLEGVRGGLATLLAFVGLLVTCFVSVSRILTHAARAAWLPTGRRQAIQSMAWGLGVAMAAHCTSWISVSYFGQILLILYLHLALIAALQTDPALRRRATRRERAARGGQHGREGPPAPHDSRRQLAPHPRGTAAS